MERYRQNRRKIFRKEVNGYFTVEASMIVPIIILLIAALFYLTFFLYNRCVLSQDAYILAFYGSTWCGMETDEVKGRVEERLKRQSEGKYVGLYRLKRDVTVSSEDVTVSVQGDMRVPQHWKFTLEKKAQRICPVEKIRRFRLIKRVLNKTDTEFNKRQ